jgi:anaerobic magnesium-protoporphyrin IX monomethyl ester cyclase
MAKVLFTHSYFYRFDPKQWRFKQPYPPLGTILAAAVMREVGWEVQLFDTNLALSPEEIIPVLAREKPDYLVIYDDGFNYLTKMCLTNMREAAFKMAQSGKKQGCQVIAASSDSTDRYENYLDNGIDIVVAGEGELSLKELLVSLQNGQNNWSQIDGLIYRKEGKTIRTRPRAVMKNLDELPVPAWDLVAMDDYKQIWLKHHGYFSLNIATTRGCPFKCNWCAKPIYGNRYHSRSPQKVAEEIAYLLTHYQPSHFWMCDDIFGLKPGWVRAFREAVEQKKLVFKYKIQSRVDLLVEEDTVKDLIASGLETVWVGAESGSQKILDAMDKGTKVEQIYQATRLLKQKGAKVAFFLQFGYPGETQQDIQMTLRMVSDLLPDDIGISISYPLPGTQFYENVKQDLHEKTNWTDSDEMALLFQSTFSPAYYKHLHRHVHQLYRRQRGLAILRKALQYPHRISLGQVRSVLSALYHEPATWLETYRLRKLAQ